MTCLIFHENLLVFSLCHVCFKYLLSEQNVRVTENEDLSNRYNIGGIREKVVLDENQSTTLVLMVLLSF